MGIVLLVKVDPSIIRKIKNKTVHLFPENSLKELDQSEFLSQYLQNSHLLIEVLVLGSSIENPIQMAQLVYAIDHDITIILLSHPNQICKLRRAVLFAPFLGPEIICISIDKIDRLIEEIKTRLNITSVKRKFHLISQEAAKQVKSFQGESIQFARAQYIERILEQLPVGIVVVGQKFNVLSWNKEAANLFLISERDILGQSILDLFPNTDLDTSQSKLKNSILKIIENEGNQIISITLSRIRNFQNQYIDAILTKISGKTQENAALLLLQDTTKRRATQDSLVQKTLELEQFFNLSLDLLCIASINGYFYKLNPAWEKTLGYDLSELIGKNFLTFIHPEDRNTTYKAINKLKEGEKAAHFVNRYLHKNKTYRWIDWHIAEQNNWIYVAARDISEQVQVENKLKTAKNLAEAASRMKTQFLDIAAHELKTPLTALTLLLQLIRKQVKKGIPMSANILDRLDIQTNRLTRLVDDLLDVSRLDRGLFITKPVQFDLRSLISECISEFEICAPNHLFIFKKPNVPVYIKADPLRIYQVISNLLDNAAKYTSEETAIEVEIANFEDRVQVSVTDHGPGISHELQPLIFTRFFRATSDETIRQPGLGLGLSICRSILELHGGSIWIKSEPKKGSTFYFELPKKDGY